MAASVCHGILLLMFQAARACTSIDKSEPVPKKRKADEEGGAQPPKVAKKGKDKG